MAKNKKIYFNNESPSLEVIENQIRKRISIKFNEVVLSQIKFKKTDNQIHLIDKKSAFPIISTPPMNLKNQLILVSSTNNIIQIDVIQTNGIFQNLKTIVKYIYTSLFHKSPSSAKL